MGVYEDLLEWSLTRPRWQQHALRRLITAGNLSPQDVHEIADLALRETSGEPITADAAEAAQLPAARAEQSPVALIAVCDVHDVNAIADDSRLEFSPQGMTVIYGANGSGKSGYVRILRQAIRTRAPEVDVHPNVFADRGGMPTATIVYAVGDEERSFAWSRGAVPPDELSAMTVYDRDCATVYVSRENEVAYRPFGLDLLDRLASAVESVRADLDQRRYVLRGALPDPQPDVAAHLRSRSLWPATYRSTLNPFLDLGNWTESDATELQSIDRALSADDPNARRAALTAISAGFRRAAQRCTTLSDVLGQRSPTELRALLQRFAAAEEARGVLAQRVSAHSVVEGVGTAAWRALWEAARDFSAERAYPQHEFPAVHEEARCVLCQQRLDEEAARRMRDFHDYVSSDLGRRADAAARALEEARTELAAVAGGAEEDAALARQLELTDAPRAALLVDYLTSARRRAELLLGALESQDWDSVLETAQQPAEELEQEAARLAGEARMAAQAGDATAAARLRDRRIELRTRLWVRSNVDAITEEIDRLVTVRRIGVASGNCSTTAITNESNALTERYVTRQLATDLAAEARRLGASRVRVRMAYRGERGATFHRIELTNAAVRSVRVDEVLSEGEFSAIAMAAHFAEVQQAEHPSGLVFDDPVSSLDHVRRSKVADRLAEAAESRQVIVLTHDLVFLHELESAAARREVPVVVRRLKRDLQTAGIPEEGPPWHAMKVRTRFGVLETQLARARGAFDDGDADRFAELVRYWYGLLRDTWERAVEEVLLGDVVIRFRPDVKTQSATSNKLWLIEERDVRTLHVAMTRASALQHDQPQAVDDPLPEPDEMAGDLQQLRDWVRDIIDRRR